MFAFIKNMFSAMIVKGAFKRIMERRADFKDQPGRIHEPFTYSPYGRISRSVYLDTKSNLIFGETMESAVSIEKAKLLRSKDQQASQKNGRHVAICYYNERLI